MFLQNTYKFVVGYAIVKAEGYFVERLINLFLNRNIEIWDIERKYEGIITFKIKIKDLNKIDELANITKSNITIIKKVGVPNIAFLYSKRKIFVFISVVVLITIYLLSLRIWDIEITGNKSISIEEVMQELQLENVKIGMKKKDLDFDKIKNNIYMKRKDILWMGFDIKGTKAIVEILERTKPDEDEFKDVPCDIISDKDGVIEKISVRDGTRMVNVGDIVYKGDKLVSGIVSSQYSEDRYVSSNADITLKTWYTAKKAVPYEQSILSKSGNVEKKFKLKIGNYIINLTNNSTKFEKYDTISNVKKFILFGKFNLPIELYETTYEEYLADELVYTKEQAEKIAKEEALILVNQNIPSSAEIIDNEYKVFYANNEVIVRVTTECREEVGIKQKINY